MKKSIYGVLLLLVIANDQGVLVVLQKQLYWHPPQQQQQRSIGTATSIPTQATLAATFGQLGLFFREIHPAAGVAAAGVVVAAVVRFVVAHRRHRRRAVGIVAPPHPLDAASWRCGNTTMTTAHTQSDAKSLWKCQYCATTLQSNAQRYYTIGIPFLGWRKDHLVEGHGDVI
jgi:hypothetical protein